MKNFDWTKLSDSDLMAWFTSESVHLTMNRPETGQGFEEVARRFIAYRDCRLAFGDLQNHCTKPTKPKFKIIPDTEYARLKLERRSKAG